MMARLTRGIAANGFAQLVTVGGQIVSVPLLVRAWGADGYGAWVLLAAIPAALAFADGGLAVASGSAMTMMVARHEGRAAAALFRAVMRAVVRTCLGLAALSIVPLALVPAQAFACIGIPLADRDRAALAALIAVVLVGAVANLAGAALRAGSRYAASVTAGTVLRLAEMTAILAVAAAGGGRVAAATAWFAVRALGALWLLSMAYRHLPWLAAGPGRQSADLRPLRAPALASLAMPAAFAAGLQGVTVAIGAAVSPEAVALFAATRTLARASVQAAGLVNHALMPEMARLAGGGDRAGMAAVARLSTLSGGVLLGLGWLATLLFGSAAMHAWTGGRLQPDPLLIGLVATAALLHGLWLGPANLLLAVNRQAAFAWTLLGSAVAVAGLAWPVARAFGLEGVAALTLAGEAVVAVRLWRRLRPWQPETTPAYAPS